MDTKEHIKNEIERKEIERKVKQKLEQKINISLDVRHIILIMLIIGVLLFLSVLLGDNIRGREDEQFLINVLAYWKLDHDCSKCDMYTCMASQSYLQPFNLSQKQITGININNTNKQV